MDIDVEINLLAEEFNATLSGFNTNLGYCEQAYVSKVLSIVKRGQNERKKVAFSDQIGNYFYMRMTEPLRFTYLAGSTLETIATVRLVVSAKKTTPYLLEGVCREALMSLGKGSSVKVLESETDVLKILPKEILFEDLPPDSITIISIDFQIRFRQSVCFTGDCRYKIPCVNN